MTRKLKNPKAILRRALKILEKNGWAKGIYQAKSGECCLVGAIEISASGENSWMESAGSWDEAESAVKLLGFAHRGAATEWNDRKSRKFSDVKARIEQALAQ